jgi:hypothetical protein
MLKPISTTVGPVELCVLNPVQLAVYAPASRFVSVKPVPCVPALVSLQSFNATATAVVFETPISTTCGFTVAEL